MNHKETLIFPPDCNITPESRDLIERYNNTQVKIFLFIF